MGLDNQGFLGRKGKPISFLRKSQASTVYVRCHAGTRLEMAMNDPDNPDTRVVVYVRAVCSSYVLSQGAGVWFVIPSKLLAGFTTDLLDVSGSA